MIKCNLPEEWFNIWKSNNVVEGVMGELPGTMEICAILTEMLVIQLYVCVRIYQI